MGSKWVLFIIAFCFMALEGQSQENLQKKIIGKWCNPYTYESSGELKGFDFRKNGTCKAINIPSLDLKTWEIQGDRLIIKGFTIGEDGQREPYETDERIDKLDADSLALVAQEKNPRVVFLYLNTKVIKQKVKVEADTQK